MSEKAMMSDADADVSAVADTGASEFVRDDEIAEIVRWQMENRYKRENEAARAAVDAHVPQKTMSLYRTSIRSRSISHSSISKSTLENVTEAMDTFVEAYSAFSADLRSTLQPFRRLIDLMPSLECLERDEDEEDDDIGDSTIYYPNEE